jgi:hypothetical protein
MAYKLPCERVDGRSWSDYQERIRQVLKAEYGIARVPGDVYREQWLQGNSVQEAIEQIRQRYERVRGRG